MFGQLNIKSLAVACTFLLLAAGLALGAKVEDSDGSVSFNGAWAPVTDVNASGGSYHLSSTAGSTVMFNFSGTGLTLYRELDPAGGAAAVTVDGQAWGTISFYFFQRAYQIPAVIDQLPAGNHQIVLTVSANAPQNSTGANVYIDAFEFPVTFTASPAQQNALTRLNSYRTAAGLPAANLSAAIDLASQAHAAYNGTNNPNADPHGEVQGNPGFIGAGFGDRLNYYGYDQPASEDWAGYTDPNAAVDDWLDSVYHRIPLLTYSFVDIGFGADAIGGSTMDFGNKHGMAPNTRQVTNYPANKQTNVPTSFAQGESPDPINGAAPYPVGFPISVHIDQPANVTPGADTIIDSGTLADSNGNPVPVIYIDRNSDQSGFLKGDDYFMIPMQPLATASTYTATMSGTDLQGHQFTVTWSFNTVPNATIVSPLSFQATATSIWIQWDTAGPVMVTSLQYGATTAYGTPATPTPNNTNDPLSVAANLTGLTANTTYHYLITATDAQGNTATSGDLTFTTPAQ